MKWYGVKIIYVISLEGEPTRLDEHYKDNYIAYEESVVIFKASSFEEAYDKAKVHGKDYEDEYSNYYGQRVVTNILDLVDCFLMNDDVTLDCEDGVEVYSSLIESTTDIDPKEFLKSRYTMNDTPAYMLLNIEFTKCGGT